VPATTDRAGSGKPGKPGKTKRAFSGFPLFPEARRARQSDLPRIRALEAVCFQPYRQASPASLRRSLSSKRQSVWVVDGKQGLSALLVLWHHPHRVRVYDVAVHPDLQGKGLGLALMAHAERLAKSDGARFVTLEADPKESGLVAWYERQGYVRTGEERPFPHDDTRFGRPRGPGLAFVMLEKPLRPAS